MTNGRRNGDLVKTEIDVLSRLLFNNGPARLAFIACTLSEVTGEAFLPRTIRVVHTLERNATSICWSPFDTLKT